MNMVRRLSILLLVILVVLMGLGANACGGGEEASPSTTEEVEGASTEEETVPKETEELPPALPAPGEWTAQTDFGTINFTVTANSQGISAISLNFPGTFKCGGISVSGGSASVEFTNPSPITNGRFTVDTSISLGKVSVSGIFDKTGQYASGTWDIATCTGEWETE